MEKIIALIENEIATLKEAARPSYLQAMDEPKTETVFELERYGAQKQIQVLTRLQKNIEIIVDLEAQLKEKLAELSRTAQSESHKESDEENRGE